MTTDQNVDRAEGWIVLVGEGEVPWTEVVPLDPASDWVEAPDDIIPGYRRTTFADEAEANRVVDAIRANGLSAATEFRSLGS